MLVSEVRTVLTRHWRFVVSGLLATVALSIGLLVVVPPQYETKAMVVLLPPRSTEGTGGNPYLSLGGLDTAAAVLGRAMGTTVIADSVARVSPTATFEVAGDPSTSGPVLVATVDDTSPKKSLDALDAVLKEFGPKMTELQLASGAPGNNLISIAVVTQDTKATTVQKTQLRLVVVAVALGLGLTAIGASLLDRRRRRRQADPSSDIDVDFPAVADVGLVEAPETERFEAQRLAPPVEQPIPQARPVPQPRVSPTPRPAPAVRPSAPVRPPAPVRRPSPRLRNGHSPQDEAQANSKASTNGTV